MGDRWCRALGVASALGAACLILSLFLPLLATQCQAAAAAGVEASGKIRIAFAGDSIVDNYWSGIERIVDANLDPRMETGFGNPGAGRATEISRWPHSSMQAQSKV